MKKLLVTVSLIISLLISISPTYAGIKSIRINKSYHLLYLYDGSSISNVVPVCIGKSDTEDNQTPPGNYKIANIVSNPKWYFEGKTYEPYTIDKNNGLGVVWMGITLPSYGLHGTNEPFSPGFHLSHGCVRMQNTDALKISREISVGTPVEIEEGQVDSLSLHLQGVITIYNLLNLLNNSN